MARRKLRFLQNTEQGEHTPTKPNEDFSGEEPLPKKTKSGARITSEPVENGSACSSPSVSGFIVMPAQKPKPTSTGKKKTPSSKVFSDEDIIALLKGLAIFWAKGRNNKWAEFHNFIKGDLSNQPSKTQVSEKIRTLKKKFERVRANGGDLHIPDSHEKIVFQLSNVLWGDEEGESGCAGNEKEKGKGGDDEDEKDKIDGDDEDEKDKVDGDDETNKIEGEMKQVEDDGAVNKIKGKRKQVVDEVNESAEEKMKMREEDEKDKIGGGDEEDEKDRIGDDDEDEKGQIGGGDETNKIEGEMKQVEDGGAVNKKKRKRKRKQVVDEVNERAEEKMKMMEDEKEKLGGGDEDEKGKIGGDDEDGKGQIGGGEETNKIEGEMKQVEDDGAVNKKQKKRKRKQVVDEVNESAEEKMKTREEDEKEKIGGGDEGEKGRIGGDDEDGKGQIGVGEETNKIEGEMKQVEDDGAVNRKQRKQKRKQVVNESAEEKMKMREEEFKCAFPLLYASLTPFKDKWMLIPLEKAQELEHTWTELKAEVLGLELKRIDLMRRDLLLHRQRA